MLDLVVAGANGLLRAHTGGDVAAHAQAALVGELGDERHELRLDRAVDLGLLEAERDDPVQHLAEVVLTVDDQLRGAGVGAGAVDDGGEHEPRPDRRIALPLLLQLDDRVDVVTEVARARHAVGDVEQPLILAHMLVHVPEAGHDGAALRVDHFRGVGWLNAAVRTDHLDAIAAHEDRGAGRRGLGGRVEEPGVGDEDRAR